MSPSVPYPPMIANRYLVRELLGAGAMGQVWRVSDTACGGRELALKMLLGRADAKPSGMSRLLLKREFRWMTQVRHPHCCEVYDYGETADGTPYFTMEVVPGAGLDDLAPLPPAEVRLILVQLLWALGALHRQGFVHRDIKLANVRLRPDGVVKLMDFGLMGRAGDPGEITGTPAYMAPEAITRSPLDGRADLYGLGVLGYALLTGQLPYTFSSARELMQPHARAALVPPSRLIQAVTPELERVVTRLLAPDPNRRYASVAAVLADLGEALPPGLGGTLLAPGLVDRAAETAVLCTGQEALAAHKPGGGVVITGALGLGKSALAASLRVSAQLASTLCATGTHRDDRRAPYAAIADVLRALLPAMREHLPATLASHAAVLAQIVPEIGGPTASDLGSASLEHRRLHAALSEVFVALAAVQPFIIILEDCQWAHPASVELAAHMLELAGRVPMMWVLTARDMPPAFALPAGAAMLPLAPLAPPALTRMIADMLGASEVPDALVAQVARASGGVPFYAARVMDYLVRKALLVQEQGHWRFLEADAREVLHDTPVRLMLGSLDQLSSDARRLCRLIAVLGGATDAERLAEVTALPDEALLSTLDELVQLRILRSEGIGRYRFDHEECRALILSGVDEGERRGLHDAVAIALEAALGDAPLETMPLAALSELAHHRLAGARPERAIPIALAASVRHAQSFATDEALALLRSALAAVEADPSPAWNGVRLEIVRHTGQLLLFAGQATEARTALLQAEGLAETLGATHLLPAILSSLARAELMLSHGAPALGHCDRALAACEAQGDHAAAIQAMLTRSRIHLAMGDYLAALRDATMAVDAARALSASALEGHALAELGALVLAGGPERRAEAVAHLEQARERLAQAGEKLALARSDASLGLAHRLAGAYEAATECHTRQLMTSLEVGHQDGYVAALAGLAVVALEQGAPDEALKMVGDAQREARQTQNAALMQECQGVAIRAQVRTGRIAEAVAGLTRLAAPLQPGPDLVTSLHQLAVRIDSWLHLDHTAHAWEAAETMHRLCQHSGVWCLRVPLAAWRSELAQRLGRPDVVHQEAETLALAARTGSEADRLIALESRARMALKDERWDDAWGEADAGLALARACGAAYRQVSFLGLAGDAALARGQREAWTLFDAMGTQAGRLGCPLLSAQAAFGLAAARPYAPEAARLAAQARDTLERLASALDPAAQAWFWEAPVRARIREGNYIGYGLPRTRMPAHGRLEFHGKLHLGP